MTLKMASFFCGCGGGDLGFSKAGFEVIESYDNDPKVIDIYNQNQQDVASVKDLTEDFSLEHLKGIDLVLASPPCQGFSTIGKRRYDDPRNLLLPRAAYLASIIKPKVIIIENVSGVIAGKHKDHWNIAHEILRENGYYTSDYKINCTDIGIPQKRKRILLIASLDINVQNIALDTRPMQSLKDVLNIPSVARRKSRTPLFF